MQKEYSKWLIKTHRETSLPVYKLKEWKFEDQFWNIVEWKICACWKMDVKHKMEAYTNYGWSVRKIHVCQSCLDDFWDWPRLSRNKKEVHSFHCSL
jgi:hypothetical protein